MLPAKLTLTNAAYALDGGTTVLMAADEAGRMHSVMLVQHSRPASEGSLDAIPGRLYFDDQLVPIRSEFEAHVLSLLRAAEVRYRDLGYQRERVPLSPNALILGDDIREVLTLGPEENIRALTARVVQFVESDQYLAFAERVELAADPTKYDIWVAWDEETFNKGVVATKRLMRVTMGEAKEVVEQGRPVAQGVSASDVVEWARRYREAGLGIRVSPEFRWRVP